jgi:hypothetical protein
VKIAVVAMKQQFKAVTEQWTSKCITPGQSRKIRVTRKAFTDFFKTIASEVVRDIQGSLPAHKVICVTKEVESLKRHLFNQYNGSDVYVDVDSLAQLDEIAGSSTLVSLVRQFRKAQTITNEGDAVSFASALNRFEMYGNVPVFDPHGGFQDYDEGSCHRPPSSLLLLSHSSLHACPLSLVVCPSLLLLNSILSEYGKHTGCSRQAVEEAVKEEVEEVMEEVVEKSVEKSVEEQRSSESSTLVHLVRQFRKAQPTTNQGDSDSKFASALERVQRGFVPVFDPLGELKDDGSFLAHRLLFFFGLTPPFTVVL